MEVSIYHEDCCCWLIMIHQWRGGVFCLSMHHTSLEAFLFFISSTSCQRRSHWVLLFSFYWHNHAFASLFATRVARTLKLSTIFLWVDAYCTLGAHHTDTIIRLNPKLSKSRISSFACWQLQRNDAGTHMSSWLKFGAILTPYVFCDDPTFELNRTHFYYIASWESYIKTLLSKRVTVCSKCTEAGIPKMLNGKSVSDWAQILGDDRRPMDPFLGCSWGPACAIDQSPAWAVLGHEVETAKLKLWIQFHVLRLWLQCNELKQNLECPNFALCIWTEIFPWGCSKAFECLEFIVDFSVEEAGPHCSVPHGMVAATP